MPIDISLQFNGHNSYRAAETVRSQPFGVQGKPWITHSLHAMANSNLTAAVRAETRFYRANGLLLSKVSHSFTVGTLWDKVVITVAVPALAVQAQIALLPGPTTWWWVEAKSEEGQTATPYNINYAGQLTKLTPTGAYTGLLSVEQIVVRGTQLNPEENLGQRLLSINSSLFSMINDLGSKGQRITAIEAGQITLRDSISNVDGGLTGSNHRVTILEAGAITLKDTVTKKTAKLDPNTGLYVDKVTAAQVKTGLLQSTYNSSWINLDDGRFSFGNGALAWNGSELAAIGSFVTKTGGTDQSKISITSGKIELTSSANKKIGFISDSNHLLPGNVPGLTMLAGNDAKLFDIGFLSGTTGVQPYIRLNALSTGKPQIELNGITELNGRLDTTGRITAGQIRSNAYQDSDGKERIALVSGGLYLKDHLGVIKVWADATQTLLQRSVSSGAIGVDASGPFYITNAQVKKYLT